MNNKILKSFFLYLFQCKYYTHPYCGPNLPPKIMIWTNLNLHHLRIHPHKLLIILPIFFFKEEHFWRFLYITIVAHPTRRDHDLDKLKTTLPLRMLPHNFSLSGQKVFEKMLEKYQQIFTYSKLSPFYRKKMLCAKLSWN